MGMMTYDEMHDYISAEMKGLSGPDAISKALKVNYHLNQNGAKHLTDDERSKLSQLIMTAIGEPKKQPAVKEAASTQFPALSSLLEQERVIYKMSIDSDAMGFTPMATINKYLKANPDIDIAKEDSTETVFTAYSKKDLQELFANFFETPYKELRLGKVSIVKA